MKNKTSLQMKGGRKQEILHPRIRFSSEEDEQLKKLIKEYGTSEWELISQMMPGRNVRQVKERWLNYLKPDVNKNPWTKEEEELLIKLHDKYGNKWKQISLHFHNRTEINIKSKFQKMLRHNKKEMKKQPIPKKPVAEPIPEPEENTAPTLDFPDITEPDMSKNFVEATYDYLKQQSITNDIDFFFDEHNYNAETIFGLDWF